MTGSQFAQFPKFVMNHASNGIMFLTHHQYKRIFSKPQHWNNTLSLGFSSLGRLRSLHCYFIMEMIEANMYSEVYSWNESLLKKETKHGLTVPEGTRNDKEMYFCFLWLECSRNIFYFPVTDQETDVMVCPSHYPSTRSHLHLKFKNDGGHHAHCAQARRNICCWDISWPVRLGFPSAAVPKVWRATQVIWPTKLTCPEETRREGRRQGKEENKHL